MSNRKTIVGMEEKDNVRNGLEVTGKKLINGDTAKRDKLISKIRKTLEFQWMNQINHPKF